MTKEEAKSCICTIEMLQKLAYNIHGAMDAIDADNCKKIIKALEQELCEDAISRVETVQFLANHSNDFEDAKVKMAFKAASSLVNNPHNLPSVKPVACIATVKFNKEDMQKIVDEKVKEIMAGDRVTCKDCKHLCHIEDAPKVLVCGKHNCQQVSKNYYCADGERRK